MIVAMATHSPEVEEGRKRYVRVGFAIRNPIAQKLEQNPTSINDRTITMCLLLQINVYATIISLTMINTDAVKEEFYNILRETVSPHQRQADHSR